MSRGGAVLLATVALLTAACSLLGPTDENREALDRAHERWQALGLESYTFLVRRACECLPETTGPFEVRVIKGQEPVVIRPEDGERIDSPLSDAFPSVTGLFALVDDAFRRGAYRVDVDYDDETGTPLHVVIDYDANVADEELIYWSTVPEPLD